MSERPRDAQRAPATGSKQLETGRAVVTEWRFPPGGHTGWHRHEHDYVVVPITSGELLIWDGDREVRSPLATGVSYARDAGVEHDVINPNEFEFVFVEVELIP